MRKIMPFLCLIATVAVASPASADDAHCGNTPRDQWLSEATIRAKVAELGYEVRKVEEEKGCYEVEGLDKNGAKVEIYVHPATGEIVKPGASTRDRPR